MDTRDKPSQINRILTPPTLLISGGAALCWFFYRLFSLIAGISSDVVLFDKGSFYMLGVGVGLLSLGFVVVQEFWVGSPISRKQNKIFTRMVLFGIATLIIFPHITHFLVDRYLMRNGYSVCEEASHQWLFVRDIVYISEATVCRADLI